MSTMLRPDLMQMIRRRLPQPLPVIEMHTDATTLHYQCGSKHWQIAKQDLRATATAVFEKLIREDIPTNRD
jgi:hypothetical protein